MNPLNPEALEQVKAASKTIHTVPNPSYTVLLSHRFGQFIGLAGESFQTASVALYGEWAAEESALLESLLHPGDWALDVGANVGSLTLAFANSVRDWSNPRQSGRIFSFEPQLYPFNCLVANIAINSITHIAHPMRCAVGSEVGEIDCPILDPRQANNFGGVSLVDKDIYTAPLEKVPVLTIDSLQYPKCNLIKADVEGMEPDVLRGAYQTISKFRPIIWTECLAFRVGAKADLLKVFEDHDYKAWAVNTLVYSPRNLRKCTLNPYLDANHQPMLDQNVLAIPKETEPPPWINSPKSFYGTVEEFT